MRRKNAARLLSKTMAAEYLVKALIGVPLFYCVTVLLFSYLVMDNMNPESIQFLLIGNEVTWLDAFRLTSPLLIIGVGYNLFLAALEWQKTKL